MGERVLVLLRVSPASFADIYVRVAAADQGDRLLPGNRLSLDEVAIVPDESMIMPARELAAAWTDLNDTLTRAELMGLDLVKVEVSDLRLLLDLLRPSRGV